MQKNQHDERRRSSLKQSTIPIGESIISNIDQSRKESSDILSEYQSHNNKQVLLTLGKEKFIRSQERQSSLHSPQAAPLRELKDPNLKIQQRQNFISSIKDNIMTEIHMQRCNLIRIPPHLSKSSSQITYIDISHNNFELFPVQLTRMCNLKILIFNYNKLNSLHEDIGDLVQLQILSLAYNRIKFLPASFRNLINLNELNLSVNLIENIPNEISQLEKLEILYLNKNAFQTLPVSIYQLKNLKEIGLGWFDFTNPEMEIFQDIDSKSQIMLKLQDFQFRSGSRGQIEFFEFTQIMSSGGIPIDFQVTDNFDRNQFFYSCIMEEIGISLSIAQRYPQLINQLDILGHTPFTLCMIEEKYRSVDMLLQMKVDLKIGGGLMGKPIHLSAFKLQSEVVQILLEQKIPSNEMDGDRNSALHICFGVYDKDKQQAEKIVKLLLQHGCDPNTKNLSKLTPLMIAAKQRQIGPIEFAVAYNRFLRRPFEFMFVERFKNFEFNFNSQIKKDEENQKLKPFDFNKTGGDNQMTLVHIATNIGFMEVLQYVYREENLDMSVLNQKNQTIKDVSVLSTTAHQMIQKFQRRILHKSLLQRPTGNYEYDIITQRKTIKTLNPLINLVSDSNKKLESMEKFSDPLSNQGSFDTIHVLPYSNIQPTNFQYKSSSNNAFSLNNISQSLKDAEIQFKMPSKSETDTEKSDNKLSDQIESNNITQKLDQKITEEIMDDCDENLKVDEFDTYSKFMKDKNLSNYLVQSSNNYNEIDLMSQYSVTLTNQNNSIYVQNNNTNTQLSGHGDTIYSNTFTLGSLDNFKREIDNIIKTLISDDTKSINQALKIRELNLLKLIEISINSKGQKKIYDENLPQFFYNLTSFLNEDQIFENKQVLRDAFNQTVQALIQSSSTLSNLSLQAEGTIKKPGDKKQRYPSFGEEILIRESAELINELVKHLFQQSQHQQTENTKEFLNQIQITHLQKFNQIYFIPKQYELEFFQSMCLFQYTFKVLQFDSSDQASPEQIIQINSKNVISKPKPTKESYHKSITFLADNQNIGDEEPIFVPKSNFMNIINNQFQINSSSGNDSAKTSDKSHIKISNTNGQRKSTTYKTQIEFSEAMNPKPRHNSNSPVLQSYN